jgi:acyl-CoA reductase-like NAD-dependent aldehyde dehydrogenase
MKVADGFEPGAVSGPRIDMKAVAKVEVHIADAVKKGAKVVTGGRRSALGGTFFEPTFVADVTTDMVITKEETFGRSPRSTVSRPRPTRSRWPTTPLPCPPPLAGRG